MVPETPDFPPASLVRRHGSPRAARAARRRLARRLGPLLQTLAADPGVVRRLPHDPVSFVHRFADPLDQELVGLVASGLAYGNVVAVRASIARALEALGPRPAQAAAEADPAALARDLAGFVHRWTRGPHLAALVTGAARAQGRHGSLGALFAACLEDAGGGLSPALAAFVREVRGPTDDRGLRWLLPDPAGGGALKRLHMYLRWMVRGPDPVDLGLWSVPTAGLLMPLDTHTSRIARYVGLTDRKDASWRTAEEVTWNLRGIDPVDPVRFDFALAHLGISGDCAHVRDPARCGRCDLVRACRL